jgi:hypothetical protein
MGAPAFKENGLFTAIIYLAQHLGQAVELIAKEPLSKGTFNLTKGSRLPNGNGTGVIKRADYYRLRDRVEVINSLAKGVSAPAD